MTDYKNMQKKTLKKHNQKMESFRTRLSSLFIVGTVYELWIHYHTLWKQSFKK